MIKFGLIGCGYWGPNLVRNLCEISHADVKIVADLDDKKLKKISEKYPRLKTTNDYKDVLADPEIEAVIIVTPALTHFELAKEAFAAGKHVLVEKPMTSSTADGEKLIRLAEEAGKVLMTGHTFIYSPPVIKVKELLDAGVAGDLYYLDSTRVNLGLHRFDTSVTWDLGPHDISIFLFWLGVEPLRVSCVGGSYVNPGKADAAFITMEFPGGVLGHIHISWFAPSKLRRTSIVGSKQMIIYDDMNMAEPVKVYDRGVDVRAPETFGEFQLTYREGDILSPRVSGTEPLRAECLEFMEAITTGRTPKTDGRNGLAVVRICEAAERSLTEGGRLVDLR